MNRLQKVLEGANIKLGSVVKDIQGKSARRLLERLAAGEQMDDRGEISRLLHSGLLPIEKEILRRAEPYSWQLALIRAVPGFPADSMTAIAVISEIGIGYVCVFLFQASGLLGLWHPSVIDFRFSV